MLSSMWEKLLTMKCFFAYIETEEDPKRAIILGKGTQTDHGEAIFVVAVVLNNIRVAA